MKPILAFCIALACAATVASSAPAETSSTSPRAKHDARHASHHVVSQAAAPAPELAPNQAAIPPFSWLTRLFPSVKPYPPGEGDADGLSRNIEDCNKGCIGVNPIW